MSDSSSDVSAETSPGSRLRHAWQRSAIAIPGVFNGLAARIAERVGFQAIYLSGAALSASFAVPDVGLITVSEFADAARAITAATSLPLLCDADTGFGEALNVERTVRLLEAAGAAGIHLEDQQLPKRCGHLSGKQLVEPEIMVSKIRAALAARKDQEFVVMARTDARGVGGLDDAIRRARLYSEAGADAIFPEALQSEEEFQSFARAVQVPLLANMTEFGRSPSLSLARLAALGYRMVLYPVTAFRGAMRAAELVLKEIKESGTQERVLPSLLTRMELYDLLGYSGYEDRDRAYFGFQPTQSEGSRQS